MCQLIEMSANIANNVVFEKFDESKILLLNQEILDTLETGIEFREGISGTGGTSISLSSKMSMKEKDNCQNI